MADSSIFGSSGTLKYYSGSSSSTLSLSACLVKFLSLVSEKDTYRNASGDTLAWRSRYKNRYTITLNSGDVTLSALADICTSPYCVLTLDGESHNVICLSNFQELETGINCDVPSWSLEFEDTAYSYIIPSSLL